MIICEVCECSFPPKDSAWEHFEPEVCPGCATASLKLAVEEDHDVRSGEIKITGDMLNSYMAIGALNEFEVARLVLHFDVMTASQLFADEVAAAH